jgi:hypothetical protein
MPGNASSSNLLLCEHSAPGKDKDTRYIDIHEGDELDER